jgi:hypothetical protein
MQNIEALTVNRNEALRLYRKYKEHRAYSQPIDWEIQRAYQHLSKGKLVIRALASVIAAGLDANDLPKLALCRATAKHCHLERRNDGSFTMSANQWRLAKSQTEEWPRNSFAFQNETFPLSWDRKFRVSRSAHQAQVPIVPVHIRPKRGLENYHILFEAEWQKVPPRDPYLLRRIGKADLWLVVAHWDLTEVERAALATRVLT